MDHLDNIYDTVLDGDMNATPKSDLPPLIVLSWFLIEHINSWRGCSTIAVAVSLRAKFLTALKNQEVLDSDEIERLKSWNHNSGFNIHVGKLR